VISRVFGTAGAGVTAAPALPEQVDVPADGLRAAGPAALGKLGVDLGGVGEALVPPLADVRLELVQLRFPAHAGQQLAGAGGPGEPLHGPAVQAGGAADRGLRLPGVEPLADLGVAFPGAPGHLPFPAAYGQGPVRHDRRVLIAGVAGGGLLLRQPRCRAAVFSAYSARLCHRCRRSATWIAPGAPSRAPSA
jgi:hypothetical protein